MRDVAVIGTGLTAFGKFPSATLKTLAAEAITHALEDADVAVPDVQAVFAANAIGGLITGQEMVRGQVVLRGLGFDGISIVNVENACAGGATALHLAWLAVASGQYDLVLAYGVEKMTHPDKRTIAKAIATALDVDEPVNADAKSPFMESYAERVRGYMADTGTTEDDLARVAIKAQRNGAQNPHAQYGSKELEVQDVLESTMVAAPLRLLMCSPISDGAGALVLASHDALQRLGSLVPVWIKASVVRSGSQAPPHGIARAARDAYAMAGIGPSDLDVVELHDANAASEIMRYEALGLAPEGAGHSLVRDGVTELAGALPVNPSGGLLARGHPVGATGCAQVVELVTQLRGRAADRQVPDATVALAENGGGHVKGDIASDAVHVLTR